MTGVDLRTIQELMGHKTISMTCRYAHLAPSHKLATVERLSEGATPSGNPNPPNTATGIIFDAGIAIHRGAVSSVQCVVMS
jgi:hypothetical protein